MKFFTIPISGGSIKREWSGMMCFCSSWEIILQMKLHVMLPSILPPLWHFAAPVLVYWLMIQGCPHSAFIDPSVPKGTPSRVSIEIRAILMG
jgi:hypothetical protein